MLCVVSLAACLAALPVLAGCGDRGGPAAPDMARGPTDHPALWTIENHGTIQTAPEVTVVVWKGDEQLGADTADFMTWMLTSDFWTQTVTEYGVGPGSAKGLIVLPDAPPATLTADQVRAFAASLITDGRVSANSNAQIAFLVNPTTQVTTPDGTGCEAFAGYHGYLNTTAGAAAYSVTLRCAGQDGSPLDQITFVLSHETVEAATDPVPQQGWIAQGPRRYEVADLCNFNSGMSIDVPADATHPSARRYWVERIYSNLRAQMNNVDPCVPLPWDRPYWNVALDPSVITLSMPSSLTLDARLDVFAYGDVGEIKWFAIGADSNIVVTPASGTAHAGDTIPVTITLDSTASGLREIDVLSESAKAGAAMWFSYVQIR